MRRVLSPAAWALVVLGCSTLAPKPPEVECVVDEDCGDVTLALACESGVCRDASENPPLEYIGFDLQEVAGGQAQFRAEIAGCDREVDDLDESSIKVLSLPRREIAQRLLLGVYTSDDPPAAVPSTFALTQGSRFARDPLRRQVNYSPLDDAAEPVEVAWPRYHVDDDLPSFLGLGGYLTWQTQPLSEEGVQARALRYQLISPPVAGEDASACTTDLDCCPAQAESCDEEDVRNACIQSLGRCRNPFDDVVTYTYPYADDCDRELRGRVVSVDSTLSDLGPIPGAAVTVRHADPPRGTPLGLPRLDEVSVADRMPECDGDSDCAQGLRCNEETAQCELPLSGLTAWTGTLSPEPEPGLEGQVDARVYTYCEGLPVGEPVQRSFDVTITPPEALGSPSVTLQAAVSFDPIQAGQKPAANFPGNLCIPALGPLEDVTLALSGEPRRLLSDYTCCDIDCLPRTAEDAESGAPEPQRQCAGATTGSTATFRVESPLALDDDLIEAWNDPDSPCVPIQAAADGTVGIVRRSGACGARDDDGMVLPQCDLRLPASGSGEDGTRRYTLRIETPTGSVAGSRDMQLDVEPGAGLTLVEVELPDRILLRGRLVVGECDPEDQTDGDCGSPGARVLAERLRMSGESVDNTPGPYFHQVATFHDPTAPDGERDGAYILPLDEGVWVLTALPDPGTSGGPAPLSIVDLRGADAEVRLEDIVLEPGILVTLDVSNFDRRSQVIPLDIGSWRLGTDAQLLHPDRVGEADAVLELGAPGECLSTDPTLGCRIRRLIAGSSLPPTQLGQVRFTTRDLGLRAVDCR